MADGYSSAKILPLEVVYSPSSSTYLAVVGLLSLPDENSILHLNNFPQQVKRQQVIELSEELTRKTLLMASSPRNALFSSRRLKESKYYGALKVRISNGAYALSFKFAVMEQVSGI